MDTAPNTEMSEQYVDGPLNRGPIPLDQWNAEMGALIDSALSGNAPDPSAPKCGARHAGNPTIVPCMLPEGHDTRAPHWSTSGCAGGACQWFDTEPDHWPGRLPQSDPVDD